MTSKIIIKGILFILFLSAGGYLLKQSNLGYILDEQWLDTHVMGAGILGRVLFVAVAGLLAGIGFPRQAVSFAGGYAFGLVEGAVLGLCATVLGCACAFWTARFFGRDIIAKRLSGKARQIDSFLGDNPFCMALLIRLLPVGSNLLTNITAGISSVAALPFIAGSTLGFIPQTFIFSLVATGVSINPTMRLGLSIILFSISAIMGIYLYRRFRHGRSAGDDIDRALEN